MRSFNTASIQVPFSSISFTQIRVQFITLPSNNKFLSLIMLLYVIFPVIAFVSRVVLLRYVWATHSSSTEYQQLHNCTVYTTTQLYMYIHIRHEHTITRTGLLHFFPKACWKSGWTTGRCMYLCACAFPSTLSPCRSLTACVLAKRLPVCFCLSEKLYGFHTSQSTVPTRWLHTRKIVDFTENHFIFYHTTFQKHIVYISNK